jgi:recombination protein RecR
VVALPQDLAVIENTGEYQGVYHVLGGVLNAVEGITPEKLKIKELLDRIKSSKIKIKEVILAFNPDLEGESTTLYLTRQLKPSKVKITRLAKGLPTGADLEYADAITVSDALKGRREI